MLLSQTIWLDEKRQCSFQMADSTSDTLFASLTLSMLKPITSALLLSMHSMTFPILPQSQYRRCPQTIHIHLGLSSTPHCGHSSILDFLIDNMQIGMLICKFSTIRIESSGVPSFITITSKGSRRTVDDRYFAMYPVCISLLYRRE